MTKSSSKARARAPGSLKETEDRLSKAIIEKFATDDSNKYDISSYPQDIIPDKPIKSGSLVIKEYSTNTNYKVPFSADEDGNYVLGEKEEVQPTISYESVKSNILAVEKKKDHVLFTGTALIPGEPDCDAANGEEILTAEKVAKIAHSFMDYQIIDKEHEFLVTKKNMGDPVESYLLEASKAMKNIKGEEREYPAGTWVVKSKITDPEMMQAALKGELAYSVSVLEENDANKVMASMKGRVLIKDIKNPVGFTLSLTKTPCVDNSCSVKSANKAGRSISKQNKSVLEKARDIIDSLINKAEPGTNGGDNMTNENKDEEFVKKSDLKDIVGKAVEKAMKSKEEDMASKEEPAECDNCKAAVKSEDKFCKSCGTKMGTKSEEDKKAKGASKSLKPNGENPKVATKSFEEELGRDLYGCKL